MKKLTKQEKLVIEYALQFLTANVENDILLEDRTELTPDEVRNIIQDISL